MNFNTLSYLIDCSPFLNEEIFLNISHGLCQGFNFQKCIELEDCKIVNHVLIDNIVMGEHLIDTRHFVLNSGYKDPYEALEDVKNRFKQHFQNIYIFPEYFRVKPYTPEDFKSCLEAIDKYSEEIPDYIDYYTELDQEERKRNSWLKYKKEKQAYVYLIQDTVLGYYKIGYSKKPKDRLKTLQISTGNKLIMIYNKEIENALEKELELHNQFKSKRLASEWFDLSSNDIETIKLNLENATNN